MKHVRTTMLVLLAVILVLGLGTVSTAATGLTTKAVKRIAAQVVHQKAGHLNVRHAKTAGDAATLNGIPASRLQSGAYVLTLKPLVDLPVLDYMLASVPSGQYLVTYSVSARMTIPGSALRCAVYPKVPQVAHAWSIGVAYSDISVANASGVMTVGHETVIKCSASAGSFTVLPAGQAVSAVYLVPLDYVVTQEAGSLW